MKQNGENENYLKEPAGRKLEKSEETEAKGRIQKVEIVKAPKPDHSEIQKVEVTNPPDPDVPQKVEITNLPTPLEDKEIQKVEVTNPQGVDKPVEKLQGFIGNLLEKINTTLSKVQKVEVTNQQKPIPFPDSVTISNLPIGVRDDAKKGTNPERYVPVRLTNGKQFYKALEYAMSGGGGGGGDKISPATIGEILTLENVNAIGGTEIVFEGEVIAFEVQCRTSVDIQITNTQDWGRYFTIKAGVVKSFTLRMTRGWWVRAASGTVTIEIIGLR